MGVEVINGGVGEAVRLAAECRDVQVRDGLGQARDPLHSGDGGRKLRR